MAQIKCSNFNTLDTWSEMCLASHDECSIDFCPICLTDGLNNLIKSTLKIEQ